MFDKDTIQELVLIWEDTLKGGYLFLRQTEDVYGKLDPSSPIAGTIYDLMYGTTSLLAASLDVEVGMFEEWAHNCGFGKHWMNKPNGVTIKTTSDLIDYIVALRAAK